MNKNLEIKKKYDRRYNKCDFCFNLTLSEIKKDHLCKTLISDGNTRTFCNCYCNAKRSNI